MPRRRLSLVVCLLIASAAFGVSFAPDPADAAGQPTPRVLWIDCDPGVDDAAAIVALWRMPNVQVAGFSLVYGNTTVENAAANLLTLQEAADHHEPVVMGAAAPLERARPRVGAFIHGPDGFWFQQQAQDLSRVPTDVVAALTAAARAHAGQQFAILALGPLTNIAQAVTAHPDAFAGVSVIWLGGAKNGGNITPVAEANSYADPEAVARVLASGVQLTVVPLDAFGSVTYDADELLAALQQRTDGASQLLTRLLPAYWQATASADGATLLPDAAAAAYAARPTLAEPVSALVQVIASDDVTRGMTVMATEYSGRVALNAQPQELDDLADRAFDPTFDLQAALAAIVARQPDNARVVLTVRPQRITRVVERALLNP